MFARSYAPVAPADFVLGRPAVGKVVEDFDRYDHVTDRQLRESGPNRLDLLFGERAAPPNRALSSGRNMEPEQQSRAE